MSGDEVFKVILEGRGTTIKRDISALAFQRIINIVFGSSDKGGVHQEMPPHITRKMDGPDVEQFDDNDDAQSSKSFMNEKRPKTDLERITCLAYYQTHFRKKNEFKTKDLMEISKDAAQPRFSNPGAAARNAVQLDYLTLAGGGHKRITTLGEALVNALPDRERVKVEIEKYRGRKPRRSKAKRKEISK